MNRILTWKHLSSLELQVLNSHPTPLTAKESQANSFFYMLQYYALGEREYQSINQSISQSRANAENNTQNLRKTHYQQT